MNSLIESPFSGVGLDEHGRAIAAKRGEDTVIKLPAKKRFRGRQNPCLVPSRMCKSREVSVTLRKSVKILHSDYN